MLLKLNERIQGLIAWIVISLIAITFTLFGVDYYMQSHHDSDTAVLVNGIPISNNTVDIFYRRARELRTTASSPAFNEKEVKTEVLERLIESQAIRQAAEKAGFIVTKDQANAAIVSIPQFQQDGRFSSSLYQRALSGSLFTPDTFQQEVRQGMVFNQLRFAFIGSDFALPSEVIEFVKLYLQTRDYQYLLIPAKLFLHKEEITDNQIAAYYQKHASFFIEPETVSLDYVRLSMKDLQKTITPTEEEIQNYYQENQDHFRTPIKWQVAHISFVNANQEKAKDAAWKTYQALQKDARSFTKYVKTLSSDKLSAATGGVLPWISAGETEWDNALLALTKPGQISPPIKTQKGYEIFQLVHIKPATLQPLIKVKPQIQNQLQAEKAQEKYATLLEELTDISYQSPDSLLPVAKELHLTMEKSKPFSREVASDALSKNKKVREIAFSNDVLHAGNNSEPVQLNDDTVVVFRLHKHTAASQKPLSIVREEIVDLLAKEQASAKAQALAVTFMAPSTDKKKQQSLLQSHHLFWKTVTEAQRDQDTVDPFINALAFSLPKKNSEEGKALPDGNFVIVRLQKIKEGEYASLDKEQQRSFAKQIETTDGMVAYDLYIKSIMKNAKIEKS